MILDWANGQQYFGFGFWECWSSGYFPIPTPSGYKAGGGIGWVAEYPTGRDLWKLKRDDRDLLEIIAAITRVLN